MKRALFALLCLAGTARANPLDTFGFGSRGTAMGGAVVADSPDASAGYYNPACLAQLRRLDISVGYFGVAHQLSMEGKSSRVDPVRGISGGFVAPGAIFGFPFAFGIAVHLPDDRLSRVRALRQETPRWELYDNRNQRLYLAANVALALFPWLEIGGGVSFMSNTVGTLDVTGEANIISTLRSQLRHQVEASLGAVRYPQAGARLKLRDDLFLGIAYRGEFKLDLDLRARLDGDITVGAAPLTTAYYALRAFSVNAFLPQQVAVGTSWRPRPDLHLNMDFTWINWSAYVAPVAKLDVALDIPPPQGGWPGGIQPPTVPTPTAIVPMKIHDRVVPRFGVEWRALDRPKLQGFVRGGYELAKSPIADQSGVTNYVDRDRHSISLGLGARFIKPIGDLLGDVRLDTHAQLSILPESVTRKSDPADFVGDYRAGGTIVNAGATLSVGF